MGLGNRKIISIFVIVLLIPFYLLNNLPHAEAASVANGYSISNFATGFVNNVWGPIGLAMDTSGNLFVQDARNNGVYKFGPGGGVASPATLLATQSSGGFNNGLTFDKNGNLYLVLDALGQIVQLNPADGTIIRTVASGLPTTATGIATDPLSGDLFVSVVHSDAIYRISNFANGLGTVTTYANVPTPDGLAFGPDGTLYAAAHAAGVAKIAGTNSPTPGAVTIIASVTSADGLAISKTNPTFLYSNNNDGTITKIDLSTNPSTVTTIVSGISRGDLATVGSDGCLYATQPDSVLKITNADGSCMSPPLGPLFPNNPSTSSPPPSIVGSIINTCGSGSFSCAVTVPSGGTTYMYGATIGGDFNISAIDFSQDVAVTNQVNKQAVVIGHSSSNTGTFNPGGALFPNIGGIGVTGVPSQTFPFSSVGTDSISGNFNLAQNSLVVMVAATSQHNLPVTLSSPFTIDKENENCCDVVVLAHANMNAGQNQFSISYNFCCGSTQPMTRGIGVVLYAFPINGVTPPPTPDTTTTFVSLNPTTVNTGGQTTVTATVTDTSSDSNPTGTVNFDDGNPTAGGIFSSESCTPSGNSQLVCIATYAAPNTAGSVTINANYPASSNFATSFDMKSLTVTLPSYDPLVHGFSFSNAEFTTFASAPALPTEGQIEDAIKQYPGLCPLPDPTISMIGWAAYIYYKNQADKNGYCYGMSKASIDLFNSGHTPPVGKLPDSAATMDQFKTQIINDHLGQVLNVIPMLQHFLMELMPFDSINNLTELALIALSVSPSSPMIIGLTGNGNHAVVAYKVKNVRAGGTEIDFYDNRFPGQSTGATVANDFTLSYSGMTRLTLLDGNINSVGSLCSLLQNSIAFVVHSPVDIAVVNETGQYVGIINGQPSQGFPAIYDSDGEDKIIIINKNIGSNYKVVLTGTGTGTFTLESLASLGGQNTHSVTTGSTVKGKSTFYDVSINPDNTVTTIESPTSGKVTGDGHLDKGKNFAFDVRSKDGSTFNGHLEYHDKTAFLDLDSTQITFLSVDSSLTHTIFGGQATSNGDNDDHKKKSNAAGKLTFLVSVTDPDKKGSNDQFSITVTDNSGKTVYQNSGTVQGHIEIHNINTDSDSGDKNDDKNNDNTH